MVFNEQHTHTKQHTTVHVQLEKSENLRAIVCLQEFTIILYRRLEWKWKKIDKLSAERLLIVSLTLTVLNF